MFLSLNFILKMPEFVLFAAKIVKIIKIWVFHFCFFAMKNDDLAIKYGHMNA